MSYILDIIDPMLTMDRALMTVLPHAATRQLADGQTYAELATEVAMTGALAGPLGSLYRWPFRAGLTAVPQTENRSELAAWLAEQMADPEAAAELRATLPPWLIRAYNVGGGLGLQEIGDSGSFTLRDAVIGAAILSYAEGMTQVGGYHSLVDTTVNELAILLSNARIAGLSDEELGQLLARSINGRSNIRAGAIALDQVIRWINEALREVYARNQITYEIYQNRPEMSEQGPCLVCLPYHGLSFPVKTGPALPQHNRCVCVYVPDLREWDRPAQIWRGD
jgi:hypothetical protein